MSHTPTQVKQAQNRVPASIKAGRVLLLACGGLFLLFAIFNLVDFGFRCAGQSGDLSDPYSLMWTIGLPFVSLFMVGSAIGAFSYVQDKGPFISLVALMAIVSALLCLVVLALEIRYWLNNGALFSLNFAYFVEGIVAFCYFVGWLLANNWLD